MKRAMGFSGILLTASIACFIHAFLPFFFEKTASSLVNRLYDEWIVHEGL